MHRLIILAVITLVGLPCFADSRAALPQQTEASITKGQSESTAAAPQAVIAIQLSKGLDAKKLKAGDRVTAKTTSELRASNGVVVPIGSTVVGQVVEASARSKGASQSSLALAFDSIVLKDGQQLPLKASIQAVGAPPFTNSYSNAPIGGGESPMPSGGAPPISAGGGPPMTNPGPLGGANPGGVNPGTGLPRSTPSGTQDAAGHGNAGTTTTLSARSTGVVGIRGLELQANSTLTSDGKDLKLDSGTEMILRVQNQ